MNCPKCGGKMWRDGKSPGGIVRWRCRPGGRHCYTTTAPWTEGPRDAKGNVKRRKKLPSAAVDRNRKVYVITWAQNATPVNPVFLACLKTYCRINDAQLLVVRGRYKNPTSRWSASQSNEETWAPELEPYLMSERVNLNANLVLLGDYKVQPTAVRPLTGTEGVTGAQSTILGHPKLQLKTVATPANKMAKLMTTTGAVTVRNYTDSRAGKGGEFHHVFGATVVEIVNSKLFHVRQLNYSAKHEGFIDLDRAYYAEHHEPAPPYHALVFGDTHARFADKTVVEATFGKGGLVERLNPGLLVYHDLLDAYAVNPHHVGNPFIKIAKHRSQLNDIEAEVRYTIEKLVEWTGNRHAVIVPSNHDDMLKRWIMREDWRTDPVNAAFYLETALQMVRSATMTEHGTEVLDPFQYWVRQLTGNDERFFCAGRSFTIDGIELALHGDSGPNGARGSVQNLSRIGARVISGHGHSPAIEEGHYRTGTMTPLRLEYTGPVGGWLNTHCSVDAFGKRHLHTCINGRFWL